MRYRKLGRTGVEVSTQCLGAMMFGAVGNADPDACVRMVHRALDAGINFIDTADVYSRGESEQIVGRALKGRRDDVVIATKCFMPMSEERNHRGASRRWIVRAVEDSLLRIQTDHLDLFQIHRHDHDTDLDETLGALGDLVRSGKLRYIGSSSYPAEWIVEAQWVSRREHLPRFVSEQPQYSILARRIEADVLPTCQRHGMAVLPWSPLAGGLLTGKYRAGAAVPEGSRFSPGGAMSRRLGISNIQQDPRLAKVEPLERIAREAGLSLLELALGFVSSHPAITATIIGPKTENQLEETLATADLVLGNDVLDAIDEVVEPGTDAPGVEHYVPNPALDASRRRGES